MLAAVPPPVTVRVPAKINLHLAVGSLRTDGFHDLVTAFHAVSLFDEHEIRTVLGHEAGHILSDHVLYRTALIILPWHNPLLLAEANRCRAENGLAKLRPRD